MNICIIYHSKYGNGKKLVSYLGTILDDRGHEAQIHSIQDIQRSPIPSADLYVFSAPTHIGGPPGKMKKFLKNLEAGQEGGKYALITTTMDGKGKSLQKMENLLETKGLINISQGLSVMVNGMKGPLRDDYPQKLETFIAECLERLSEN